MRSYRFRPNNDKFPSFRHGDVWLAQVNWFERWQRKAALRFSRKSGEQKSGWEAIYGALKLRDRIRGENWRCDLNSVQFRFQLGLREKCWTLDQVIRADTRKEKRFSPSITDHRVFLRVRLHCAN